MKKRLGPLLLLILSVSTWASSTPPMALAQTVAASMGSASAAPGTINVEVPLSVSDVSGLGVIAADIELSYSGADLTYASASVTGTLAESWGAPTVNSSVTGTLRIAMYGVSSLTGAGMLVKILFNVKSGASPGSSNLALTKCSLNDARTVSTILSNGVFTITSGTTRIGGSTPPNGYVDSLEDKDSSLTCNGSNTGGCRGLQDITISFSEPVTAAGGAPLSLSNFQVRYFRNNGQLSAGQADLATQMAPAVSLVSGSGAGPYTLRFLPRLPLGAWTEIEAVNVVNASGAPISTANGYNKRTFGFLPMDVTQDGRVLGDDINRWILINGGGYPTAPLTPLNFCDQKRNGMVLGEDIARAIQLINGTTGATLMKWSGFDMGARP